MSRYKWVKRWSFSDNLYCGPYIISKIYSPAEGWHLEKVTATGHTEEHIGTYSRIEAAQKVAEQRMDKEGA